MTTTITVIGNPETNEPTVQWTDQMLLALEADVFRTVVTLLGSKVAADYVVRECCDGEKSWRFEILSPNGAPVRGWHGSSRMEAIAAALAGVCDEHALMGVTIDAQP